MHWSIRNAVKLPAPMIWKPFYVVDMGSSCSILFNLFILYGYVPEAFHQAIPLVNVNMVTSPMLIPIEL